MQANLETARSQQVLERLERVLPGGDTRAVTFYEPFPLVMERGDGALLWDADGNEFIDLVNNYTSLVHGHAHPAIVDAIAAQAAKGSALAAPHELQGALAERICDRVSSVELVRFTNSGTEAGMAAIRAARAITGRNEIVKANGGYNGAWDQVPMTLDEESSLGVPSAVLDLVHMVRFNDVDDLRQTMQRAGSRVAAIILEPVLGGGGIIPGSNDFFRAARALADEHGALLVLDEVITFRLRPGGWQATLGVEPDLTMFGKIIGGGLPVGAVGGRAEVMNVMNPRTPRHFHHSGTFNGNLLTMAAGAAALDLLTESEIDRINSYGARVAQALEECSAGLGANAVVTNAGSLLQIHFGTERHIESYEDVDLAAATLKRFHRAALEAGVFVAPRGLMCTSTAMNETIIQRVIAGLAQALEVAVAAREPVASS